MTGADPVRQRPAQDLETQLANRSKDSARPLCAIIDFQMGWTKRVFWKFNIPFIGFFTFGACAAAMEWGAWKVQAGDTKPGEIRSIFGLPEDMAFQHSDTKRRHAGPPRGGSLDNGTTGPNRPAGGGGPPKPGDCPPWVPEIEGSVALMFNTCDDLERPFINYMSNQMGMPTWGVGPLLPSTSDSLNADRQIRQYSRESNCSEDYVMRWLDSKPRGSVLYVAFGSEVGPKREEYPLLAGALVESRRPYIWVIQSGEEYVPDE